MHSRAVTRALIAPLVSGFVLLGCSNELEQPPTPSPASEIQLGIENAANSSASMASLGSLVVVAWGATASGRTDVFAATSRDGGVSFSVPVRVNDLDGDARVNGEQPPRVALGRDIVVAWTSRLSGHSRIRLARSADGGRSFAPAVTVHGDQLTGARGWTSLAMDERQSVHASWLDGRNSPQATPHDAHVPHTMRQDVYHAVWRPAGGHEETQVAANVCFCCKTSTATAPDSTVYVAWRHIYPTNLRDMAVARSTDGGRTFGEPVRVSEDGWVVNGCPEDGPSIGVGNDGVLHIAWPTLLRGATERKAVFYSYSADGGRTFAPRVRLDSDEGTRHAAHPQLVVSESGAAIVWEESTTTGRRVRLRAAGSNPRTAGTTALGVPITIAHDTTARYPAVAAVPDGFVVAWTSQTPPESTVVVRKVSPPRR